MNEQELLTCYVHAREEVWASRFHVERIGSDLARGMRRKSGLSLRDYAKSVGVDHSYLSKIENGRRPLTFRIALRMFKAQEAMEEVKESSPATEPATEIHPRGEYSDDHTDYEGRY